MSGLTKQQITEIKALDGVMVKNHVACALGCGSSDGMSVWQKEYQGTDVHDGFCYSCHKYVDPNTLDLENLPVVDVEEVKQINTQRIEEISKLPSRGWRERCITKKTSEYYGVKTELDSEGNVLNRFYPIYMDGKLAGYKARNCISKNFWSVGRNGTKVEMFGQKLFPKGGKKIIICGGEEDAMSAFQMLTTEKYLTPCVSPTVGEGNCATQIKNNFEYISSFGEIILMLDNDTAGKEAAEACAKLFRAGQVKTWKPHPKHKDVNDYLVAGDNERFKNVFFNTEVESPAGILESSDTKLWDAIIERASTVKIPLPPFAEELESMLRGGPALGEITLLAAASSIGKTSLLNAFTYYWIFNAPYKVGIISLESDLGEFGENLLSLHIQNKLANLYDEDKKEVLSKEETKEQYKSLVQKEDGDSRFVLLDHQSSIMDDELKRKIEYMVKVLGCKIIILDPLTLALSGQSNDGIDAFNAWYLRFVKREQIAAFNVLHVRKNGNGVKANSRGGELSEEDIKGSGSIFQTAAVIWLMMRDKYSECPITRNTTKVVQSKARRTGQTGPAGFWYYNNDTGLFEKGVNPEDIDTAEDDDMLRQLGAYDKTDPDEFLKGDY